MDARLQNLEKDQGKRIVEIEGGAEDRPPPERKDKGKGREGAGEKSFEDDAYAWEKDDYADYIHNKGSWEIKYAADREEMKEEVKKIHAAMRKSQAEEPNIRQNPMPEYHRNVNLVELVVEGMDPSILIADVMAINVDAWKDVDGVETEISKK
ncbi:hypothetical protein L1049_011617 [Liquidambar formosana]|uniref:Uncharacterized protein n=1 Tax=Liquidambar formosana TaxID=63359 RepID=A0AAP0X338_LIQFO